MPRLTSSDSTYLGAEVPLEVAAEFKRRARDHERSATGQLRQLIREFAPDRRTCSGMNCYRLTLTFMTVLALPIEVVWEEAA